MGLSNILSVRMFMRRLTEKPTQTGLIIKGNLGQKEFAVASSFILDLTSIAVRSEFPFSFLPPSLSSLFSSSFPPLSLSSFLVYFLSSFLLCLSLS